MMRTVFCYDYDCYYLLLLPFFALFLLLLYKIYVQPPYIWCNTCKQFLTKLLIGR